MDQQQCAHSESNDMSEININRFIEAARQYLFGLFPVDAVRTQRQQGPLMAFADNLPINESLGVFVGVAGIDWLVDGQAEPMQCPAGRDRCRRRDFRGPSLARKRRKN